MIDQDKDGFISKNDIRQTFDSLGMRMMPLLPALSHCPFAITFAPELIEPSLKPM